MFRGMRSVQLEASNGCRARPDIGWGAASQNSTCQPRRFPVLPWFSRVYALVRGAQACVILSRKRNPFRHSRAGVDMDEGGRCRSSRNLKWRELIHYRP